MSLPSTQSKASPVEHITQELEPGTYWTARRDLHCNNTDKSLAIPEGSMVMLYNVRSVLGKPHMIVIKRSPLTLLKYPKNFFEDRFLVDDFLEKFTPAHQPDLIREKERVEVQSLINESQGRLSSIATDDDLVIGSLPVEAQKEYNGQAGNNIVLLDGYKKPELIKKQVKSSTVLLTARASQLKAESEKLSEFIGAMTAFAEEAVDVAIVKASHAKKMVEALESGLKTLGIYTGEESVIHVIEDKGQQAHKSEPLTLFQSLLFMDEESLVNAEFEGADFDDFHAFCDELKNSVSLQERLIPAKRGVVAMQFRRKDKDYNDTFLNKQMADLNRQSFLIFRNGDNWYAVFSPIKTMTHLFPTRNELDAPFKGFGGKSITLESLRFSDANSRYDRMVLHYKRVLILIWGLYDHHKHVIGDFYLEEKEGHLNLMSLDVQKKVFRFISDSEDVLGVDKPSFSQWLEDMNSYLQSGSRVLVNHQRILYEGRKVMPSCWKEGNWSGGDTCNARISGDFDIYTVKREKHDFYVEIPVSQSLGYSALHSHREFNAKAYLNRKTLHEFSFLVMDNVNPDDVEYYMESRSQRENYIQYIHVLSHVRKLSRADVTHEATIKSKLWNAMDAGGLAGKAQAKEYIDTAVRQWRCANRGADIPFYGSTAYDAAFKLLLNQLWLLIADDSLLMDAKSYCEKNSLSPVRLSVSGKSIIYLYVEPSANERIDQFQAHIHLKKITLKRSNKGFTKSYTGWDVLRDRADETTMHEWDNAEAWKTTGITSYLPSPSLKKKALEYINKGNAYLSDNHPILLDDDSFEYWYDVITDLMFPKNGGSMNLTYINIPFAIGEYESYIGIREPVTLVFCISALEWLWLSSGSGNREVIEEWVDDCYLHSVDKINNLRKLETLWQEGKILVTEEDHYLKIGGEIMVTQDPYKNHYHYSRDTNAVKISSEYRDIVTNIHEASTK